MPDTALDKLSKAVTLAVQLVTWRWFLSVQSVKLIACALVLDDLCACIRWPFLFSRQDLTDRHFKIVRKRDSFRNNPTCCTSLLFRNVYNWWRAQKLCKTRKKQLFRTLKIVLRSFADPLMRLYFTAVRLTVRLKLLISFIRNCTYIST